MSDDSTVDGEVRPAPRRKRTKSELFFQTVVWMHALGLSRPATNTYAAMFALIRAGMAATASAAALLTGKTIRSMRRDLRAIARAGLWVKLPRTFRGWNLANDYVLVWQPCMPEALRGEPIDDAISGVADGHASGDTSCRFAVTPPSRLKNTAARTDRNQAWQGQPLDVAATSELPSELLAALSKATLGHTDDCLRVMRELTATMPPSQAKAATITALRGLIARCERGPVRNPAGLLRSHVGPDAIASLAAATQELEVLAQMVTSSWVAISKSRGGFTFLRSVRVFENHQKIHAIQHRAMFAAEPSLAFTQLEAPFDDFVAQATKLLSEKRGADDRGASEARRIVEESLASLERLVDQHFASQRAPE
jgi:hypothetical protein